ncbi:exported protein of unknown function [Agrobacterium pusense]|uniref:Uncharacterized protein n=1 Tax=Agrobacterium pusense TaxID=648995 RepID=U4PSF7_9HYPH|nr:exported protein of unknown function [Agrobacterium pusense]
MRRTSRNARSFRDLLIPRIASFASAAPEGRRPNTRIARQRVGYKIGEAIDYQYQLRRGASPARCGNRATGFPILYATLPIAHFFQRFFHINVAYDLNRSFARKERRACPSRDQEST